MVEQEDDIWASRGAIGHPYEHGWVDEDSDECAAAAPERNNLRESWEGAFKQALGRLAEGLEERRRHSAVLAELQARVRRLEATIGKLSQPSLVIPIATFAPEPFDLLQEIRVVIQPSDDEYLATFFDANVNASGCTETDALESLKELLLSRFVYLDNLPPEKLGPGPAKQIAVLRSFMRKRS